MFLFGVQVFTGILLLLYYRPSAAEAYESVQFIVTQVEFGWLIRNVHSWSANLLIALAFAHFFSVFFLKSYRKPRELTWLTGILLLFLMLGFGFSGYLLPWNELSFFATKVGTGIAGAVPLDRSVHAAAAARRRRRHRRDAVAVLRAARGDPAGDHRRRSSPSHLLLVQRQGMSVPLGIETAREGRRTLPQMPFFPNYILRDVLAWYVVLAVVAALAAFYPWELGQEGRSVRRRAAGHPARVVLPRDVPHAEAGAEPRAGLRRRAPRRRGVRARRRCSWCSCRFSIAARAAENEARCSRSWRRSGLVYLVVFTIIGHYAK